MEENTVFRRCGNSGLMLSPLALGLWHNFGGGVDIKTVENMCLTAYDSGITYFDLADNYGPPPGSAEENFGKIMKGSMGKLRDNIVIATKAGFKMWDGPYGDFGSRKHLIAGIDASLRRLKLEYVDIFYHHRPDPATPIEETVGALSDIVRSGKALYAGISNYGLEQAQRVKATADKLGLPIIIDQVNYSLLERSAENGLLAAAKSLGMGVAAFSPLAQGLLTDRYLKGIPEDSRIARGSPFLGKDRLTPELLKKLNGLNKFAASRGQSLAELAVTYLLSQEEVTTVIIGASLAEQIKTNVRAASAPALSGEEIETVLSIVNG